MIARWRRVWASTASGRFTPHRFRSSTTAFTPTAEQIARAQKIITAYDQADISRGAGAIVIDDEMVDAATLRVERKRLEIARKAGLL